MSRSSRICGVNCQVIRGGAYWQSFRTAPTVRTGRRNSWLEIGVGSTAAGLAALAIGFLSYIWLTRDTGPASIGSRTEARDLSGSGTIQQKRVGLGTAGSYIRDDGGASLDRMPFGERFSFDQSAPSGGSLQSSQPSAPFQDRFIGEVLASSFVGKVLAPSAPVWSATDPDPIRAAVPRVTMAAAASRRDTRSGISGAMSKRQSEPDFRLASASGTSFAIAYAPSNSVNNSASTASPLKGLTPKEPNPLADIDTSRTAIYDISARTVYLPNGRRLEAHSGLGDHMDDPRYVNARGTGPTPPNVYELKLRETLFHGVRAIRLVPSDELQDVRPRRNTGAFLPVGTQRPIQRLRVIQRLRGVPGCVPAGRCQSSRRGRASRGRALTEDIGGLALQHAQGFLTTILISSMQAGCN